jgi:hypothetical protein
MSADQRSVTLRQMLTKSAGFSDGHGNRSPNDGKVASILNLPLQAAPGTQFIYSDPEAQLVSAIVAEPTGMTTLDYARAKLFGLSESVRHRPTRKSQHGIESMLGLLIWSPSTLPTSPGRSRRMASATGAAC